MVSKDLVMVLLDLPLQYKTIICLGPYPYRDTAHTLQFQLELAHNLLVILLSIFQNLLRLKHHHHCLNQHINHLSHNEPPIIITGSIVKVIGDPLSHQTPHHSTRHPFHLRKFHPLSNLQLKLGQ